MNWKLVIGGGLVFFAAQWLISMATGYVVHERILADAYVATGSFWRPELMQEPPDMAALMPRWIAAGLIASFLSALVYGWVRSALAGNGWMKGLKFGVIAVIFNAGFMLGWSGVFNLPDTIWAWWWAESVVVFLFGAAWLGWFGEKYAPAG